MKASLLAIVALAAAVGGWLWFAPYQAAGELRDALDAGDAVAIEERVDFPVLRESLGDQIRGMLTKTAAEQGGDNPLGALAAGLGSLMVDGILDAFVTPTSIAALAKGEEPEPGHRPGLPPKPPSDVPPPSGGAEPAEEDEPFANATYRRDSFDRFSILVPTEDGDEVRFVMGRYGLGWKLREIRLPLD